MADAPLHVSAVYDQHPAGAGSRNAGSCKDQPRRSACAAPLRTEVIDLINDDDDDERDDRTPYDAGAEAPWMASEGAGALPTPGHAADAAVPDGPPWWTILPDFVPVAALRDGRDPRCAFCTPSEYGNNRQHESSWLCQPSTAPDAWVM